MKDIQKAVLTEKFPDGLPEIYLCLSLFRSVKASGGVGEHEGSALLAAGGGHALYELVIRFLERLILFDLQEWEGF